MYSDQYKTMQNRSSKNKSMLEFYTSTRTILTDLGIFPLKQRAIGCFYFNFHNILQLIGVVINGTEVIDVKEKAKYKQANINLDRLQQIKGKYKIYQIILAISLSVFQVSQQKINSMFLGEKNQHIFLGSKNNDITIYLQIFLEALNNGNSPQKQKQVFSFIKKQIQIRLKELSNMKGKQILQLSETQANLQYKRLIQFPNSIDFNKQIERQNYLFKINNSNINEGIIRLVKMINSKFFPLFDKKMVQTLTDQILITLGMVIFYEGKVNHQKKEYSPYAKNYKKIAKISQYAVSLIITQNLKNKDKLDFQIIFSFNPKNVKLVSQYQFVNDQINLNKHLSDEGLSTKYLCINDLIYQIDHNQNLGKGQFGRIYKGQSFQLLAVSEDKNKNNKSKELFFFRKRIAVKILAYQKEQYQNKGFKISQERELLILKLISDLKHNQIQKKMKSEINKKIRCFQDSISRPIEGIDNLADVIQIFTVASQKQENHKKPSIPFLVFDEYKQTLVNIRNQQQIYSLPTKNRCPIIYNIFKQIVQGLVCLHYDINQLYRIQLNNYFDQQNSDKNNKSAQNKRVGSKMGILHRDIKPDNIMLTFNDNIANSHVSIIDVGMGKITSVEARDDHTKCGTIYYQAPQVTNGSYYNEKVDIWSVGIMLYEMLNKGQKIFRNTSSFYIQQTINKISTLIDAMQQKSKYDKAWFYILRKILSINPQKRINARQLLHFMKINQFYLLQEHYEFDLKKLKIKSHILITQIQSNDEIDYIRPFAVKYCDNSPSSNTITGIYMNLQHLIRTTGMAVKQKSMIVSTIIIYLIKDNPNINQNLNKILESTYFIIADNKQTQQSQTYKDIFLIQKIDNPKNSSINSFDSQRKIIKVDKVVKISYSPYNQQYSLIFVEKPFYKAADKNFKTLSSPQTPQVPHTPFYNGYTLPHFKKNDTLKINTQIFKQQSSPFEPYFKLIEQQIYVDEKDDSLPFKNMFLYKPRNIGMKQIEGLMSTILAVLEKNLANFHLQFRFIQKKTKTNNQQIKNNWQEMLTRICRIQLLKEDDIVEISIFDIQSLLVFFEQKRQQFSSNFQSQLLKFIKLILKQSNNFAQFKPFWKLILLSLSENSLQLQNKWKGRKYYDLLSPEQIICQLNVLIGEQFVLVNKQKSIYRKFFIQLNKQTVKLICFLSKQIQKHFKQVQDIKIDSKNSQNLSIEFKRILNLMVFCKNIRQVSDKNTLKNIQIIFEGLKPDLQFLITLFQKLQ